MNSDEASRTEAGVSRARRFGRIVKGVIVGALLVPALLQLARLAAGSVVFNYQGF